MFDTHVRCDAHSLCFLALKSKAPIRRIKLTFGASSIHRPLLLVNELVVMVNQQVDDHEPS